MTCAGNQAGTAVEELIRLPVQRNPAMGAAVVVQIDLALATDTEQFQARVTEATALAFAEFG